MRWVGMAIVAQPDVPNVPFPVGRVFGLHSDIGPLQHRRGTPSSSPPPLPCSMWGGIGLVWPSRFRSTLLVQLDPFASPIGSDSGVSLSSW